jgi:hypothetical protein
MPDETDTFDDEDRINKVKTGFRSANIPEVDIATVFKIYGNLKKWDHGVAIAKQIAQGTKFQVKNLEKVRNAHSGDSRRQLARAIIFVMELDNLLQGVDPAEMLTSHNSERVTFFATLWAMELVPLQSMLRELINNFLASYRVKLEVVDVTLQRAPPRVVWPLVNLQEAEVIFKAMFERNVALESFHSPSTGYDYSREERLIVADIKIMLVSAEVQTLAKVTMVSDGFLIKIMMITQAADMADINYEAVIKGAAKELEKQKGLVLKALKCVEQGPWPINVIGKAGTAAVGLTHVDATRTRGSAVTHSSSAHPDQDMPALVKMLIEKGTDAKAKFDKMTRLGPDATRMITSEKLKELYVAVASQTQTLIGKIYTTLSSEIFGSNGDQQHKIATDLLKKYKIDYGSSDVRPAVLAIRKYIDTMKKRLQGELNAVISLGPNNVKQEELQKFIELKMYANYLDVLTKKGEKRDVTIPKALVEKLTADHIGLIQYKSKGFFSSNEKSSVIYASGKLPWISSGHPNHVTGLIDFFRWYDRVVDPMELVTGRVTANYLESAIQEAIKSIGKQIKDPANVKSGWRSDGTHERAEAGIGIARIVSSPPN